MGSGSKKLRHQLLARALVGDTMPQSRRERIIRSWEEIDGLEGDPAPTVIRQLIAAVRFNHHKDLRNLRVPTMVMYGTKDRFVPNKNSVKIAKLIPNCKLVAISGGGHEITIDRPNEVLAEIKTWVHRIDGGGFDSPEGDTPESASGAG